jgi:hypothetical protein
MKPTELIEEQTKQSTNLRGNHSRHHNTEPLQTVHFNVDRKSGMAKAGHSVYRSMFTTYNQIFNINNKTCATGGAGTVFTLSEFKYKCPAHV